MKCSFSINLWNLSVSWFYWNLSFCWKVKNFIYLLPWPFYIIMRGNQWKFLFNVFHRNLLSNTIFFNSKTFKIIWKKLRKLYYHRNNNCSKKVKLLNANLDKLLFIIEIFYFMCSCQFFLNNVCTFQYKEENIFRN